MSIATGATWGICAAATAGVIVRPFRWPEAIWAVTGAILLLLFGLMPAGFKGNFHYLVNNEYFWSTSLQGFNCN